MRSANGETVGTSVDVPEAGAATDAATTGAGADA
jgi:hypothetical protein